MGEVAAHAGTHQQALVGRRLAVARTTPIGDVVMDPVADRIDALMALRKVAELGLGEGGEPVRRDETARQQEGEDVEGEFGDGRLGNRRRIGPHDGQIHLGIVFERERAGLHVHAEIAVLEVRRDVHAPRQVRREGQAFAGDVEASQFRDLDIEDEGGGRLDLIGKTATELESHGDGSEFCGKTPRSSEAFCRKRAEIRSAPLSGCLFFALQQKHGQRAHALRPVDQHALDVGRGGRTRMEHGIGRLSEVRTLVGSLNVH
ncbi:hypothetical protein M2440_004162 [Methylorubrum extorquens]|nr:hypothetical protein [Methylorubrum extorquens]